MLSAVNLESIESIFILHHVSGCVANSEESKTDEAGLRFGEMAVNL